ncbi:hypothetical protein ETB97_000541 [Aspergillus alliaceus]|uniref:Protein kinase domain-containing protein n=1 Tax=Petromyces alliaceus TaxID=209559 RepID=A0A8H6E6D2_PETAA|nr:hypothetical protein ETB97_000541 [Aspergillus burnettii]
MNLAMSMNQNTKRSTRFPLARKDLHTAKPLECVSEQLPTDDPNHLEGQMDDMRVDEDRLQILSSFQPSSNVIDIRRNYHLLSSDKAPSPGSKPVNKGRFPVKANSHNSVGVDGEVWSKYHRFWKSDQAGLATIAHENSIDHKIVAVKEVKQQASKRLISDLLNAKHDNIVQLLDVFSSNSSVYLVYECLELSLFNIQAACREDFLEIDMAIIGKEILKGLNYVHNELGLAHGCVDAKNILFSITTCHIKLANIGNCILNRQQEKKSNDIKALGALLVSLTEPGTSVYNSKSLQLRRPQDVSDICAEFIGQFATLGAEELLKGLVV